MATEVEGLIVDEALQVYGGYGFTEEFPIARHYRDARVSRIYEGTNEINRLFIADRLRRRVKDGRVPSGVAGDSFVSSLVGQALAAPTPTQVEVGALSDLLMLAYAEQSARLRCRQVGGDTAALYACALPWLNARAAEAYQTLTGDSVTLPATERVVYAALAARVYAKGGPL
jgi:hypothetical protein